MQKTFEVEQLVRCAVMSEKYELGDTPGFSSLVFVRVYDEEPEADGDEEPPKKIWRGYVFVKNEKEFGTDAKWKLPGGHKIADKNPIKTAVRELQGETNLAPERADFRYENHWLMKPEGRKRYWVFLYSVDIHVNELAWMNSNHPGNEGEAPKLFTMDELLEVVRQQKFMDEHFAKLIECGLIYIGTQAA